MSNKQLFRTRKRKSFYRAITISTVIIILVTVVYQIERIVVPFQSENPLWHEVTTGQAVLDNWKYGGLDAEGFMEFYQDGESHVHLLPPNERILGLDGKFVVIEHHTASSLTYADPIYAIPFSWLAYGLALVFMLAGLIYVKIQLVKKQTKMKIIKPRYAHIQTKHRRFKPRK